MIQGKRIYIKKFETIEEVMMHAVLYNDISERSMHDHTEPMDVKKRIADFNNGLYDYQKKVKYMIFNEEKEFIGTIGYVRINHFDVNIGYRLMKHKHRQKGYLSEALPLFVKYLFETDPGLTRITLNTAYDNIGSQKVAIRSGFQLDGILRKGYEYRGKKVDFHTYSILREEVQ